MIDTILAHDPTGGGVMAVVPGSSFTIKEHGFLVGYFYDGISAEEVTITNPQNPKWDPAGFTLVPTSTGTEVIAGTPYKPMPKRVPVRKGDVLVFTATSGANPIHLGVYVEYPGGKFGSFKLRPDQDMEPGLLVTRATVAGGTNCAIGTIVQGATNLEDFPQGRLLTPVSVASNATFTTTAFLGLRKYGGDNVMFVMPIPLDDVAAAWRDNKLPLGLFTVTQGDAIELFWMSATAEQPTADITFAYAPPA